MALDRLSNYRFQQTDKFTAAGAEFLGEGQVFHNRAAANKPKIRAEDLLFLGEALNERNFWVRSYFEGGKRYSGPFSKGVLLPVINDFKTLKASSIAAIQSAINGIFQYSSIPADADNFANGYPNDQFVINEAKANAKFPLGTVVKFDSIQGMRAAIADCLESNPVPSDLEISKLNQADVEKYFEAVRRMKRIVTPLPAAAISQTWARFTYWFNETSGKWEKVYGLGPESAPFGDGDFIDIEQGTGSYKSASGDLWTFDLNPYTLPYKSDSHYQGSPDTGWIIWLHGRAVGTDANNRIVGSFEQWPSLAEHTVLRLKVFRNDGCAKILSPFAEFYGFPTHVDTDILQTYATRILSPHPEWGKVAFRLNFDTIGEEIGSDWFRAFVT